MISNHSPQRIFYTLTISAITALLLTSCGGSSSSTPIETAALPAISGTVTKADATPIDGISVTLTKSAAKLQQKTTDTTTSDGKFSVTPTATGEHQLKFTGTNFLTQYKNVNVSTSDAPVTPTVMSAAAASVNISPGVPVTASDTANVQASVGIKAVKVETSDGSPVTAVSLTLLTGVEIPSTLPTSSTTGKTLLPVGAIAMSVTPADADFSNSPIKAIVPLPEILKSNTAFPVYNLVAGEWKSVGNGTVADSSITFDITKSGTYMVMTEIANIETADVKSEKPMPAGTQTIPAMPGQVVSIIPEVKDSVKVDLTALVEASETEKEDIKTLIESFLEKKNEIQPEATTTNTVAVPAIATKLSAKNADIAAKLVCTVKITQTKITYKLPFKLNGQAIIVPVTIIRTNVAVSCADDGTGLSTGGTGTTG